MRAPAVASVDALRLVADTVLAGDKDHTCQTNSAGSASCPAGDWSYCGCTALRLLQCAASLQKL
jgi:hypothetical protein